MSRLLPVLLMRVATFVVASLLLFAVFGKAKAQYISAQDGTYGTVLHRVP